ncbi:MULTISPECIES: dihydrodipicolinate synthase family protein [Streptomyces]|uniref:Dihydrodipicolinate synthase family protein n=3 Tax=Streptomyces malaysiensis TaxID=92644 RepID=A0ABX6WIM9_STRMQ|nr:MULTISPECIES: dihydrodipicolinate synthase family protein [Streptomyces]MYU17584.1 dihydrodipicolinate synthase family protein [Streptomyces sp. SID8361]ATL88547.1 dihydrodipicolinate synthase [Streptomyces malaysiensis]AUA08253.1 4-hydroxy-tetrahydrodipicolinate synthase [Streptomyces sp. M56]MCC4320376.1 dihydrodipicolinate synthase family protein [Streptomyces malaysiensis]MCD9593143.1 dihydrodipicolinate synthase family protein [Streptomyces sp. 8ZJF_21]
MSLQRPDGTSEIKGVLPVVIMPFTDDGALDEEDFLAQTEHMFDVGCDGFVVGQVSEVLRLTHTERLRVAELSAKAAVGRGVSVMSTGAETPEAAIEYSRHAESVGVDALLVMHPATIPLDENGMVEYFTRVVESVRIPVIIHHAKSLAKQPLTIAAQVRMLERYGPDRVLFKPEAQPSPPRVSELRDASGGRARIFEGDGGMMLLDCHRRGLAGTIPATEIAEIVVTLWRLLEAGEREKAERIGYPLSYLMCHMMNSTDYYLSIAKRFLKERGLIKTTHVRGPSRHVLDDESWTEVHHTYRHLLTLAKELAR